MDKIKKTIDAVREVDYSQARKIQERLDNLTKPQGSLGRLEEIAGKIVHITGKPTPVFKNKVIFTMAADHGIAEEQISAYPQEVTAQMVYNFLRGGAAINVLAHHVGARIVVVDMGVAQDIDPQLQNRSGLVEARDKSFKNKKINYGTKNMTKGAAMEKEEAVRAIEVGIEVFEEELRRGVDVVGIGEMGIGNTTSSSAIAAVITGRAVEEVTGRGTGIDDDTLVRKIEVIKEVIELNKPNPEDAIDILSKIGGFEIGGLAGVILGAASKRIPVAIDGFISGAAALIAYQLEPKVKDYMIAAHRSVEKGHTAILGHIGLDPLLDLNLRLGEGTGAALVMSIMEASVKILTQMATFQSASVSQTVGK